MKNNFIDAVSFTALAALIVFTMLVPVGFAALGVEEGDWAKYRIEAEIPEELEEEMGDVQEIEWAKFEVQSISGATVTLEGTVHYKNGTEETETMDGTEMGLIIEADLTEGDQVISPIFFGAGVPTYINGTVSKKYAGANREVNYVNIEMEQYGTSIDLKAYWDKAKGVLCEMSMSMSGVILGQTLEVSMSIKMTETNMWEAGADAGAGSFITQWWFWAIIAGIVIVGAGSAVVLLRRRKAPLPEAAPTPTE